MRNYKRESERAKVLYDNIQVKINKELGLKLRRKLKEDERTIAEFVSTSAKEYLEKG